MQMVLKTTTTPADGEATTTTETLNFTYDASGTPMSVKYGNTTYYYAANIQGDIMAILDTSGNAVVEYTYDAWGNIHSVTGSLANTIGETNPLTYRGYVYDQEIGYYYLQSRYYAPDMGRFINADASVTTGQGLIGSNMFAYCLNNPVNGCDPCGTCFHQWNFLDDCEECGGRTFGEKVEDAWEGFTTWCEDSYDHINGVNQQQQQTNNEIVMQQNEMIGNGANAAWEAYVHSNELQVQHQYQQDMAVVSLWEDTFSSPTRFGDFVVMTFGNVSAYAAYAGLASASSVSLGPALVVGATIAAAVWSTLRYFEVIN